MKIMRFEALPMSVEVGDWDEVFKSGVAEVWDMAEGFKSGVVVVVLKENEIFLMESLSLGMNF